MNIWADLGIRWFAVWLFWLRGGGERYRGVEEFEGAALVGGGFGEHGHVGAGGVVADLVAGEGGQVVEQAAEAAYGLPRVSRTADFASIYAAICEFRYSVRTSCGVR